MRRARTRSSSPKHSADLEHVLNRDLVRLLALVDGAREALLCLAADGAVLHLNPAAEELFGVHALDVLGRSWSENLPAWLAPASAPRSARAEDASVEYEDRWLVATCHGEHELRRRELSAGEHLLFVSPPKPARVAEAREEVPSWDTVQRSSRSAERFQEWSKLAGSAFLDQRIVFSLGPALGERPLAWESAAEERGLSFRKHLDAAALARPLAGDAEHAVRALEELIDNALAFTPRGGSIEWRIESEAAGVACRVQNSGEGLGPGEWERARRAFARLSDPLDGRVPGPGLGLALVDSHLECLSSRPLARRDMSADDALSFRVSFHLLAAPDDVA